MANVFGVSSIRNIGILAHIDAGKTTTTERILFYSNKIYKMGEVHEGAAVMDWMEQEQERGITITAAATTLFWKDCQINLIDTPGHVDFTIEVERSIRVLDGAVVLLDAVNGVEAQTEVIWRQVVSHKVPRIVFINKMDRVGADFDGSVTSLKTRLGASALVLQIPFFENECFSGIIDLVRMRLLIWRDEESGRDVDDCVVPPSAMEGAVVARQRLIEDLANLSEEVESYYLNDNDPPVEVILNAVKLVIGACNAVAVLCGASFRNKGVQPLLDAVVSFLPSPSVMSLGDRKLSLVFKIAADAHAGVLTYIRVYSGVLRLGDHLYNHRVGKWERVGKILRMHANSREEISEVGPGDIAALVGLKLSVTGDTLSDSVDSEVLEAIEVPVPVISVALEAKSNVDHEKMLLALRRFEREDPSCRVRVDVETGQVLLEGMGELHLEILVDRLRRENRIEANVGKPQVSYRESVAMSGASSFVFDRLIAGVEHRVDLDLELDQLSVSDAPLVDISVAGLAADEIVALRSGTEEALQVGCAAGFPVCGVRIRVCRCEFVRLPSSGLALKVAVGAAVRDILERCHPRILEPICSLEISVPSEFVGVVIGDLGARRGQVERLDNKGMEQIVIGEVALAEVFGYATDLRSMTQGRGTFSLAFKHYSFAPEKIERSIKERFGRS